MRIAKEERGERRARDATTDNLSPFVFIQFGWQQQMSDNTTTTSPPHPPSAITEWLDSWADFHDFVDKSLTLEKCGLLWPERREGADWDEEDAFYHHFWKLKKRTNVIDFIYSLVCNNDATPAISWYEKACNKKVAQNMGWEGFFWWMKWNSPPQPAPCEVCDKARGEARDLRWWKGMTEERKQFYVQHYDSVRRTE